MSDFTTDQQGQFKVTGLPAGHGTLSLDNQQANEYEQLAPLAIEVPAKEPITIRVTCKATHLVTGRVLDTQHHPLAGVAATLGVFVKQGWQYDCSKRLTAVTGADGGYQVAVPMENAVMLLSLAKAGYRQLTSDILTNVVSTDKPARDTLDDAVMGACTATIHGTVCDAAGKPVKGATVVSAEGGLTNRAITDEAGDFTLSNQPDGELHLVAATPTGGGFVTCAEHATDIRITCTPGKIAKPHDIALVLALLEADSKLPKDQRHFNRSDTIRALADSDLALALRLSTSGDEPVSEGLRAYLLARQAEKDPSSVSEILVQLRSLKNANCKLYAAVEMGIAVAPTDLELAERYICIVRPIYNRVDARQWLGHN